MSQEMKLAHDILNYLVKQPSAKDTLEGIAYWWLLKETIDQSIEQISKAVELLIAKNYLTVQQSPDQVKYYAINQLKAEEIRQALNTPVGENGALKPVSR